MRLFWILLLVVWTLVGAIDGTDPATRIVSSGNSGGQCAAKGLLGECKYDAPSLHHCSENCVSGVHPGCPGVYLGLPSG